MSEPRERLIELLEEAIRVAAMDRDLDGAQMVLCLLLGSLHAETLPELAIHCGPFVQRQVAELQRRLEEGRS